MVGKTGVDRVIFHCQMVTHGELVGLLAAFEPSQSRPSCNNFQLLCFDFNGDDMREILGVEVLSTDKCVSSFKDLSKNDK